MNVKLRSATTDDLQRIIDLYGELIDFECQFYHFLKKFKDFDKDNVQSLLNSFEKFIEDEDHQIIVATFDDKILGFIHGHIKDSFFYIGPILELGELVVNQQYRNLGIGEALYKNLIDWGKKNNTEEINLNVFHTNTTAVDFYKRMNLEQHSMKLKGTIK